ncbi:PAS domain S-box protein [Candidatus Roizmanbacteria bacterium]|nr:PAS domain S-box protein [Candidatus Roizmanbacteria bacterium]
MDKTILSDEDKMSEESFRLLFENMLDGFAYCKMIYDDQGNPEDFIYLDVNKAFEKLTGLKDVVGKAVTIVVPEIKKTNPELLTIYGRVAQSGKPEHFETYVDPLKIHFSVSVYSPKKGFFVAVFDNINEQKFAEKKLKDKITELEKFNSVTVDRELKMIELKNKIKELETKLQEKTI